MEPNGKSWEGVGALKSFQLDCYLCPFEVEIGHCEKEAHKSIRLEKYVELLEDDDATRM